MQPAGLQLRIDPNLVIVASGFTSGVMRAA
jgi:hypothetical protein